MKISTPTLPAEIRDIIIDCLHDDKKTLSACSRVSKSWRTRSQYHIFRILTITVDGPPWPPWDLAAYNRNLPPRPYPKQSQLVQELRINGLPSDATVGHTGTAALICSLQQLRVLDINNVYLFGEGSPLVYTSNLFRVLPHLAELRALRLHDIGCESSMREVKTNPSVRCRSGLDLTPLSFARLEELVVSGASFAPHRICQLLDEIASAHKRFETAQRKPPGFCGLRRATLGYVFGEYDADIRKSILFGSYGHLLKVAGTSLEHLSICFFGTTFGGDVIGIDLEGQCLPGRFSSVLPLTITCSIDRNLQTHSRLGLSAAEVLDPQCPRSLRLCSKRRSLARGCRLPALASAGCSAGVSHPRYTRPVLLWQPQLQGATRCTAPLR